MTAVDGEENKDDYLQSQGRQYGHGKGQSQLYNVVRVHRAVDKEPEVTQTLDTHCIVITRTRTRAHSHSYI